MPELPEVETVRRSLDAVLPGRVLLGVDVRIPKLRWPIPRAQLKELEGGRLLAVRRRGKVLLMDFEASAGSNMTVLGHLGMSGRMLVEAEPGAWEKHEHLRFAFEGRTMRFIDPRRFGSIELTPTEAVHMHDRVRRLGPEPLSEAFDGVYLFDKSRGRKLALRDFLLQGSMVAGVGNIYANEACFRAKLRPGRAAGRLTKAQALRLCDHVKEVLSDAIEAGGTTLKDGGYVDGEGNPGWFAIQVGVYGREGEECRRCGGTIRRKTIGQRSAFYCVGCQL